jgi:predicted Rossmann fold flavoprotein
MKQYDVIVIGGGAAGMLAAGNAAESGAKVLLMEKMERVGRKLLITGKGRCNITNDAPISDFLNHIYPNCRFLKHAFSEYFSKDIIALLNEQGVETNLERGGRIFPASNKSADVVNALFNWITKNKVEIEYGCKCENILVKNSIITGIEAIKNGVKTNYTSKAVILCTGGCSYPATGSNGEGYKLVKQLGHSIEPVIPALVPVETEGNIAGQLQGLSLKNVKAIIWVNGKKLKEEFGEMLFTHFGLSGPIILTLSRFIVDSLRNKNQVEISIDLKPALDEQKLDTRLQRDLNENGKKKLDNLFKEWLPSKMIPIFINLLGLDGNKECHQVTSKERKKILLLLKEFRFKVSGHRPFSEAIITAGGISTKEIDPKTMESKIIKNLYFAGEVIDLDADTGGYNLQIAWSTGYLAAKSSVKNNNFNQKNES